MFVDSKRQTDLMSIPTKELTSRFLAPLRGKITILLLHDMEVKVRLSGFLLACARLQSMDATILDSDAFYCTNMDRFEADAESIRKGELLLLPEQDFEVSSLIPLLSSRRQLLIIDDLNSIYSLASDGRRSHQLTILMSLLSHNARVNGSWIIATAYRTELVATQARKSQRSLTALGDMVVDTDLESGSIKLKASFNDHWPGRELTL